MSTVAISGSRTFEDRNMVLRVVLRLVQKGDRIIVGDNPGGVDRLVRGIMGYSLDDGRVFRAHWDKDGPYLAGPKRNQRLVDQADELVAIFADGPYSNGTSDAVRRALKKGIPVYVYHEGRWLPRLAPADLPLFSVQQELGLVPDARSAVPA